MRCKQCHKRYTTLIQPKLSTLERALKFSSAVLGLRDTRPSVQRLPNASCSRSEKTDLKKEYTPDIIVLADAILNQTDLKFTPVSDDQPQQKFEARPLGAAKHKNNDHSLHSGGFLLS